MIIHNFSIYCPVFFTEATQIALNSRFGAGLERQREGDHSEVHQEQQQHRPDAPGVRPGGYPAVRHRLCADQALREAFH